ncbi:MAG: TSUP family transporter [Candidatus Cloacimonetes bacterium]|nr:TSUP family transporter [Candidatus Cloacimonadota bacterium]MDD2210076.1 TSUP family transporter [Candidatus Cloacimonadota bacterium]MDD4231622.1 TSUP family transporter [Candidatus Cloacimonadota bacterium]
MPFSLSPLDYVIVLPFIFLAGFIDAIAGGGGLISLPAYWSAGIPPHIALGTNKFSSCWGTVFSTVRYFRAGMIDIPVALISALMALAGSWLGASTALVVSAKFLNYLLVVLIPSITVLTFIRKQIGFHDTAHLLKIGYRLVIGSCAGFVIGFYDGFFGPGTGTFLIIIYSVLLHYDFVRANGNTKVVNLASNVAALLTFAKAGVIFFPIAIPGAVCGIAGNLIGSKMVILRGNRFIKQVFILALMLLLGRVIYNILT